MNKKILFLRIPPFIGFKHPHPQDILFPFIFAYAASILRNKGYSVTIMDLAVEEISLHKAARKIADVYPDFIFVDTHTTNISLTLGFLREIRGKINKKTFISAIGQHASVLPDSLFFFENSEFDACIIGELDLAAVELVEHIVKGQDLSKIEGLSYYDNDNNVIIKNSERKLISNLDDLPEINYGLFRVDRYKKLSSSVRKFRRQKWGFIMTSRGCPHNCIYCSPTLRKSFGKSYRAQSPLRTVSDIKRLIRDFNINAISIEDDNFTYDKTRVVALCNELIKTNLRFRWVAQVNLLDLDIEIIKMMKLAKCDGLCLGIESGSDRILNLLNKNLTLSRIRSSIQYIKKEKLNTTLFFMVGNPDESYVEMLETLKLAKELNPVMIQVAFCTPYPGSRLFDKLSNSYNKLSGISHYNRFLINLSRVDTKTVERFRGIFYRKFYLSPRYALNYLINRGIFLWLSLDEIKLIFNSFLFMLRKNNENKLSYKYPIIRQK